MHANFALDCLSGNVLPRSGTDQQIVREMCQSASRILPTINLISESPQISLLYQTQTTALKNDQHMS
jgi:hypothetical protein